MEQSGSSTSVAWDAIAARLEAFQAAWGRGEVPRIADSLPPRSAHGSAETLTTSQASAGDRLRQLLLVELVKLDMDERGRAGVTRPLEDYLDEFPELGTREHPPLDLVHEELHLARCRGEPVDLAAACRRFPGRASEIQNWLPVQGPTVTSSLAAVRRPAILQAGAWIDDFEILGVLGCGAFATVYRARQASLGRVVALKVSADRGDEARTLAQLDHPHIVRVYDRRRLHAPPVQLVYEQLLSGGSLAAVVERVRQTPSAARSGKIVVDAIVAAAAESGTAIDPTRGALQSLATEPWPIVVARLGRQLAAALAHAHEAGVLHRDVKPANVLLSADGTAHLADFNTSFLADHPVYGPAAYFGGSLAYMSPEQLEAFDASHPRRPEDLDGRADLYSLAVLLWELLVGRRPFVDDAAEGATLVARLHGMIARRQLPPDSLSPEIASEAAGLAELLEACMAGNRDARPAHAAEVAARLAACSRPRFRRLVAGRHSGLRGLAARFPLLAVAVCVLVPNMALGVFNYVYNHRLLVELYEQPSLVGRLPAADAAFQWMALVVNSVAFPAGLFFAWLFTRPLHRAMQPTKTIAGNSAAVGRLRAQARRQALWLGDAAAWIGVAEWIIAGLLFPIGMALQVGRLPSEVPLLFMQSPLACGLLAMAYPFFLTTLLVLRVFFPVMLTPGEPADPVEVRGLERLATRSGWYLLVAGGVPLGTLALLLARGSTDRTALAFLTVAGLVGLVVAWWAHEAVCRDAAAILEATNPADADTSDSVRTTRRPSDSTRPSAM
jgi:serine/threonine protein kinase